MQTTTHVATVHDTGARFECLYKGLRSAVDDGRQRGVISDDLHAHLVDTHLAYADGEVLLADKSPFHSGRRSGESIEDWAARFERLYTGLRSAVDDRRQRGAISDSLHAHLTGTED